MGNKIRFRKVESGIIDVEAMETSSSIFARMVEIEKIYAKIEPRTIELRTGGEIRYHTAFANKVSPRSSATGLIRKSSTGKEKE